MPAQRAGLIRPEVDVLAETREHLGRDGADAGRRGRRTRGSVAGVVVVRDRVAGRGEAAHVSVGGAQRSAPRTAL